MVYRQPIEMLDGLAVSLWEAIDKWKAIPTTDDTLSDRIAAAAEVERVVADALGVQSLINARMCLDRLAHRLRDGGPETPRDKIREQVTFAAEQINAIVPRSPLR